jgi:hypothetical protein
MTILRGTFDEAMVVVGRTGTLPTLQAEQGVARPRIAGYWDHKRELLDLIDRVSAAQMAKLTSGQKAAWKRRKQDSKKSSAQPNSSYIGALIASIVLELLRQGGVQ